MGKLTGYSKIVKPIDVEQIVDNPNRNVNLDGFANYTNFPSIIQSSTSRFQRYRQYENMDSDIDVARALDVIADEMVGNTSFDSLKMKFDFKETTADVYDANKEKSVYETLRITLDYWLDIIDFETTIHSICRNTIKYGDCFLLKDPNDPRKKWAYITPERVKGAVVNKNDPSEIYGWVIDIRDTFVPFNISKLRSVESLKNTNGAFNSVYQSGGEHFVPHYYVVHFRLDDLEQAPFGKSVLDSVYNTFKKKDLIEDAIVIYRIQRAPERLVFYIDVSDMPSPRASAYMQKIKNEINQKRVPSSNNGSDTIDSVFNPISMLENYFFAQYSDGRGSRVDVLQSGQNLGEITELEYFQNKIFRGLRVPSSYMSYTPTGDKAVYNDGKVGVAYIEEMYFAMFVKRLQRSIETVLDTEFKWFIKNIGLEMNAAEFSIKLPEPSNFDIYRRIMVNSETMTTFTQVDGIEYLSKRFIMKKYLNLSDEEIAENEKMLLAERGIQDIKTVYNPELLGGEGEFPGSPGEIAEEGGE